MFARSADEVRVQGALEKRRSGRVMKVNKEKKRAKKNLGRYVLFEKQRPKTLTPALSQREREQRHIGSIAQPRYG